MGSRRLDRPARLEYLAGWSLAVAGRERIIRHIGDLWNDRTALVRRVQAAIKSARLRISAVLSVCRTASYTSACPVGSDPVETQARLGRSRHIGGRPTLSSRALKRKPIGDDSEYWRGTGC